jgi:hypothetical protein
LWNIGRRGRTKWLPHPSFTSSRLLDRPERGVALPTFW